MNEYCLAMFDSPNPVKTKPTLKRVSFHRLVTTIVISPRKDQLNKGILEKQRKPLFPYKYVPQQSRLNIEGRVFMPTSTSHDDSISPKALNLQTNALLHVMVFHDVDLEGNVSIQKRFCKVRALGNSKSIKLLFHLLLGFFVCLQNLVRRTPVSPIKNTCRPDMEDDNMVIRA
jgi:hypothetical protein